MRNLKALSNAAWSGALARLPEPGLEAHVAMHQMGRPRDVADLLPADARAKFTDMRNQLEDLRNASQAGPCDRTQLA